MLSRSMCALLKAKPYAICNKKILFFKLQPLILNLTSQQIRQFSIKPSPLSVRRFSKFIGNLDGADLSSETKSTIKELQDVYLPHASYTKDQLENQTSGHHVPVGFAAKSAWCIVTSVRSVFDFLTGYTWLPHTEKNLLRRVMFLETIAGVPGMVGAMNRHFKSLRRIEQDYGWIHTLLEEAENERMHLMTALQIMKPGAFIKLFVVFSQGFMVAFYALAYAISPVFCHRFVGYLEEEAFHTYTGIIKDIDEGRLPKFSESKAPVGAIKYWNMAEDSTLRDVFLAIRADENHHRLVNHTFAAMEANDINPFPPGY